MAIPTIQYRVNTGPQKIEGMLNPANPDCSVGSPVNSNWSRTEYTSAHRQRLRPTRLLPTNLTYVNQASGSTTSYGCQKRPFTWGFARGGHGVVHTSERLLPRANFDSEGDLDEALVKALNRLNKHGAQFGESLATLSQTSKMIAKRAGQLAHAVKSLRRGDFKGLSEVLKVPVPKSVQKLSPSRRVADGWLELNYGWLPLVQDVYDAVDMYRNSLVVGTPNDVKANSNQGGFGNKGQTHNQTAQRIYSNGPNASVKVYASVQNANLATLNDMGLVNPALLAWQLLPFSFVVDWFIPISDMLSAMTASLGYKVEAYCKIHEYGYVDIYPCGELDRVRRTVVRMAVVNPQVSVPLVLNPKSDSIGRTVSAVALLRQSFGR